MTLTVIEIDNKTDKEKAELIRRKVFVEEQQVDIALEYDEFEDSSRHYLVLLNGQAAGTARWRHTEKGIKLERFAVLKEQRGKGAAAALLKRILNDIGEGPFIYLHSQESAVGLYEKYGFVKEGEMFLEADIRHYKMKLLR